MKDKNVAALKRQIEDLIEERDYYKSLVDSFFSGNVPRKATFSHLSMAKWGRKRLEEKRKTPALLSKEN